MSRRPLIGLLVVPGLVVSGGISAWAYFGATATTSQPFSAGTLGAAQTASASATSTSSLKVAVSAGPASPSPAAGGYAVVAPQGSVSSPVCTITANTGSCAVSNLTASTTYSYSLYSTLQSWTSAAYTTVSGETLPDKPTSVTLANGGGTGSVYINNTNVSSVSVTVALPATTHSTDTIHLSATDKNNLSVTATQPGGSSSVTFSSLNLSSLADGTITFTAWATDLGGTGASTTNSTTYMKDTVVPSAPTANYIDNTKTAADQVGGSAVANASITITETAPNSNIYKGTASGTGSFTISVDTINANGGHQIQYSYTVTATDAAGNTSAGTPVTGFDSK